MDKRNNTEREKDVNMDEQRPQEEDVHIGATVSTVRTQVLEIISEFLVKSLLALRRR